MTPALSVQNLCKSFGEFALQDITFDVPCGVVTAIIGENGSGKSTTLACILGQDIPDSGTVAIFGTDPFQDIQAHAALGVSGDISQFPGAFTPNQLESVLKGLFPDWDTAAWNRLLELCQIPGTRRIEQFSRGMKAKLSLAAALSHRAKLLILDEATAGLDPVVREELLDLLLEFMQEENHSILMTSHISSDLEKIADYIIFIRNGRIVFSEEKDTLLEHYGLASVSREQLGYVDESLILRRRVQPMSTDLLITDRQAFATRYPDYVLKQPTLDEIVLMFTKGDE